MRTSQRRDTLPNNTCATPHAAPFQDIPYPVSYVPRLGLVPDFGSLTSILLIKTIGSARLSGFT